MNAVAWWTDVFCFLFSVFCFWALGCFFYGLKGECLPCASPSKANAKDRQSR